MADVPKDLLEQIKELEELFTVDGPKLKEIVNHFVKELEKGLSVEGGSIVRHSALAGQLRNYSVNELCSQ